MARVDEATRRFPRTAPHTAPESAPHTAWSGPPGKNNILTRQLAAIPLIILLYTASIPFTPFVWILNLDGSSLFDRLFAGIAVLSACYFQWRIAGLTHPLAIVLPGSGDTVMRNGRAKRSAVKGFVWHPSNYWLCVMGETVLLGLAEFGPSEVLRRSIVCGVIAALCVVGYSATPESTKRWAYEHIKAWLFWMVLDELMRVGGRSYGGRRRRY
ncbi:hypothetical protein Cob_v008193 [Colletotrichum orbiculare MAFF 240422]|uniref:Uncharacterized protein n=1 Tax=Colletotrichum orbiculare (strain 104-T / ATCC 96160 / CBS 514.97 / LARS 414 / MAFF 240422) TaxID=1213857 RepID=N4VGQ9_COLOR|nr:hypothetical protein Cob_v008193 [Colletotrichum orbiculare MAFF 240422]